MDVDESHNVKPQKLFSTKKNEIAKQRSAKKGDLVNMPQVDNTSDARSDEGEGDNADDLQI